MHSTDSLIRERAFEYFYEKFFHERYNFDVKPLSDLNFIPIQGEGRRVNPKSCFFTRFEEPIERYTLSLYVFNYSYQVV